MNLKFMQIWPSKMENLKGEPTLFQTKILKGLLEHGLIDEIFPKYIAENATKAGLSKLHTIRSGNKWRVGDKIHFQYWTGKPYRSNVVQFAPVLPVLKVQEIQIKMESRNPFRQCSYFMTRLDENKKPYSVDYNVYIDGQKIPFTTTVELALNDGFESCYDFFTWFSGDFMGQIIHWIPNVEY